jgi:hypothetical protein
MMLRKIIFFFLLNLFLLYAIRPSPSLASTFFVDAVRGNDRSTGLSVQAAWKSTDRVNSALSQKTVQAGDTVSFKRGDTFTGTIEMSVSGKPGRPITITAYGEGAMPVLDAVSFHNGVSINGSYITLANLQVSNARNATFLLAGGTTHVAFRDCRVKSTVSVSTPTAFLFGNGTFDHITVERMIIEGITDYGFHIGSGTRVSAFSMDKVEVDTTGYGFYAEGAELSGIRIANSTFCRAWNSGIKLVSVHARDVEITGCTASENHVHGVYINGDISGVKLSNMTIDANGSNGIFIDTISAVGVSVEKCRITGSKNERNGLALDGSGNGIRITETIASRNTGDGFNVHGAWKNVVLERCVADENGADGRGWDGDGYTFHETCTGKMVACSARNNKKSAVAHVHQSSVDMERCIFTHDTNGTIPLVYLQGKQYALRNCVLYSGSQTGTGLLCAEGNFLVRNTIIFGFDTGFENRKGIVTQDHNDVFSAKSKAWKGIDPGAGSFSADPLFTNPGALDFTLRPGSSCIDAGVDSGSASDFSGTPVPRGKAPDIGAYEFER